MGTSKHIILIVVLMFFQGFTAQERINATLSSIILGGGQQSVTATLDLQPIAIVDLEPENTNSGETFIVEEAGNPFLTGGSANPGEFWLNYTYRGSNLETASLYTRINQPLPDGMEITLQVINSASLNGNFIPNPISTPLTLSTTPQLIASDFSSGYTGDGENTGYLIQYKISNPNAISLPAGFEIVFEIK